jgi:G3E family GTPase
MSFSSSASVRVPVSIVTGFLGSGKTTFISNLLRRPDMAGTGVIVNEFAALGIDDLVIGAERRDGGEVMLLKNGCVCCAPADDLVNAVLGLHSILVRKGTGAARLLIETSGLADPVPLLHRLMRDLRLRPLIRMAGVVALVDAVNGMKQMDSHEVTLKQLAVADRRIITKDDLAPKASVDALKARLRTMNPGASIVIGQERAVAAATPVDAGLFDPATGQANLPRWLNSAAYCIEESTHKETFQSWLIESDEVVDWDAFVAMLAPLIRRPDSGLLRLKGIIRTDGSDKPLVIQGVQSDFYRPVVLERWPDGLRRTAIVVIGHASAAVLVADLREALMQAAARRTQGTERSSISR